MTDFDRKLFVTEAIYTAALMMLYDKKLNDDYVRLCIEQTLKYDLGIIEKALKNWVIYNRGRGNMPQASQLAEECKRLAGKNTANNDWPTRCDDLNDWPTRCDDLNDLPAECDMTNLALIHSAPHEDHNIIVVERDNDLDIAFTGKKIAQVSSKNDISIRHTDLLLYQTDQGMYVCQTIGVSLIDGERTKYSGEVCRTQKDVINYFGTGWLAKKLYSAAGIDSAIHL
jgi:hypothetical protein